jgi:anti-sigma28 factor (negative regulator of flagellin synthesis)
MNIVNINYTNPGQTGNPSAKPVSAENPLAGSRNGDDTVTGARDQVQLSSVSRLLQTGSNQQATRVARLSSLVQSGQYGVSAANVSQSLVTETLAQSGHS